MRNAVLASTWLASGWTFRCRTEKPEDLKGLSVSRFEEEGKAHLETGTRFCEKTSVCKTTNTGNTGASITNCLCSSQQWGWGLGGALEYLVGKYRMDNSMCAQGENKPMDSDSIPEKIGLQGIETQFHSPEISPTNPTSFPAVQKPPSQRDDLGCQGNLTPE